MDVERFPSGKSAKNELVLELTILAYNILQIIGQEPPRSRQLGKFYESVNRERHK